MDLKAQNHLGMGSHVVVLNIDSFVITYLLENQLICTDLKRCCDTLAYVKKAKSIVEQKFKYTCIYI